MRNNLAAILLLTYSVGAFRTFCLYIIYLRAVCQVFFEKFTKSSRNPHTLRARQRFFGCDMMKNIFASHISRLLFSGRMKPTLCPCRAKGRGEAPIRLLEREDFVFYKTSPIPATDVV